MELLEKRVRSRFSHRKQLIPEMEEKDFDKAGDSPRDVLASLLTVPETASSSGRSDGLAHQWNAAVRQMLSADVVLQQLKLMMNQGKHADASLCLSSACARPKLQCMVSFRHACLVSLAASTHLHICPASVLPEGDHVELSAVESAVVWQVMAGPGTWLMWQWRRCWP